MSTDTPTQTEYLNVRELPTWAADIIRAAADKRGISYSAMVRIILTDAAMRYEAGNGTLPATNGA